MENFFYTPPYALSKVTDFVCGHPLFIRLLGGGFFVS